MKNELKQRWERAKEELRKEEMDFLLVTNKENFEYFTGYKVEHLWLSRSRVLMALVSAEGEPAIVGPEVLKEDIYERSPIRNFVPCEPNSSGAVKSLLGELKRLYPRSGRKPVIGLELGYEQRMNMPPIDYQLLIEKGDEFVWKDCAYLIWGLRMIKSEYELQQLRTISSITAKAFETLFEQAREGIREDEAALILKQALLAGGADAPWFLMVTSGEGDYHRVFGKPRNRQVRAGDMLWCDIGATFNGYWSDYDRAGVVGGPSKHQQKMWSTVEAITLEICDMVKPGIEMSQLGLKCEELFEKHHLPRLSGRLGHGIGLTATEPPDVAIYDRTILRPGMVFSVEPAYIDNTGMYQVEVYVEVTEKGYELMTHPNRSLQTIPLKGN
ncbi:MAG: aminopeptidase P family protein [Firmicutes bacterium]|nr:aminopeptidase P family protein [Bacillota bacterium]